MLNHDQGRDIGLGWGFRYRFGLEKKNGAEWYDCGTAEWYGFWSKKSGEKCEK